MKPKMIAFYLPQFHQIPENDQWWGEGFTEWVAARNAKPLFPGHYQPRIPLHDNYYNLLDKRTLKWQAKLARKAGIYGFCIYHYWFGDNKQLLEKPAENLLKWKDIDINYCFSWANESWIASWSKLKGNAWSDTNELNQGEDYLMQQKYGDENEWRKHFEYLVQFFKDERYIKKDNKPVFVIYKPNDVKKIRPMLRYWNELALAYGLEGIFFIGTNDKNWHRNGMDAMLLYEPDYTLFRENNEIFYKGYFFPKLRQFLSEHEMYFPVFAKYNRVWEKILDREIREHIYPGAFVDFDNSPRKGRKGTIFVGAGINGFEKYIKKFLRKFSNKEFIFITAWNEWGEGAYLEPDKKYGSAYLQVIRRSLKK